MGTSNVEITRILLQEWRGSKKIQDMLTAAKYYAVENVGIQSKTRDTINQEGKKIKNETMSNVKLPSAQLRTAVQQKVNYCFGKPFVLSVERLDGDSGDKEDDNADIYLNEWQRFFSVHVKKTINRIGTDAINKGIGWGYVWINKENQLKIMDVFPETVYPEWADSAHTVLDVLVRDYEIEDFGSGKRIVKKKVEYWDNQVVEKYIDDGNGLLNPESDNADNTIQSHMRMSDSFVSWGKIPFISLKGSEDEMPLLNTVRPFIDAYDFLNSKAVDSLDDDLDPVLVLENVSTELKKLQLTRDLLKNSRVASLDAGGKAYYVQVKSDITAIQSKLEALKKDITKNSYGVDFEDVRFGGNPNQLVIRSLYQDLDTYADGIETEFKVFIEQLKYFFDRWLELKGIGTVEQWEQYSIIADLNRDMMINNSELITDTVKLAGTGVSQETIDKYNPAVESFEIEQARRESERQEIQRRTEMFEFNDLMNDKGSDDSGNVT